MAIYLVEFTWTIGGKKKNLSVKTNSTTTSGIGRNTRTKSQGVSWSESGFYLLMNCGGKTRVSSSSTSNLRPSYDSRQDYFMPKSGLWAKLKEKLRCIPDDRTVFENKTDETSNRTTEAADGRGKIKNNSSNET